MLQTLENRAIFLVGIKGTGMSALAELLVDRGAKVSGSDTDEVFYTDAILRSLGISFHEKFSETHIDASIDLVVHSAAYSRDSHPELQAAAQLHIPILRYTEALGMLSRTSDASGISGVHGKTTTTAMVGTMAREGHLPASVVVGSAVSTFDNRSTLRMGTDYFIAETCEWRRHFLDFDPNRIVITSVELDHTDYFTSYEDIRSAFVEYALKLPVGGVLIYCSDDVGASEVAGMVAKSRPDISATPYGFSATGPFRLVGHRLDTGIQYFKIGCFEVEFALPIPGTHNVLNAVAALALLIKIEEERAGGSSVRSAPHWREGLAKYRGSRRRCEIYGERDGVLYVDDYAHHPTAIRKTLDGIRQFYPDRRLVVDFMSHTYSRTEALFSDFVEAFDSSDVLILHKIYASAREVRGKITGLQLYQAIDGRLEQVYYFQNSMDALPFCRGILKPGDLFLTLGAGDNWKLGKKLFEGQGAEVS